MSRLRTLAAIFSPTYHADLADGGVMRRGGAFGAQVLVAPRAECAYRRVDLSHLKSRQRGSAARLFATRHEPVTGAPAHVAWTDGIAHVWWWLEAPDAVRLGQSGWLPETVLRKPPAANGARLLVALRGFEGQAWTNGVLSGSQWWPVVPDAGQWSRFTRGCGLPAGTSPEPLELPAEAQPWGDRVRGVAMVPAEQAERRAWQGMAVVFSLLLGWQLAGLVHWSYVAASTETRIEALRAQSAPLLDARDRAEAARVELEQLHALQSAIDDQALMIEVGRRLPEGDSLGAWAREGRRLSFAVRTGSTDPRTYVAALETLPDISSLRATPEAGDMVVELEFADASASDAGDVTAPRDAM